MFKRSRYFRTGTTSNEQFGIGRCYTENMRTIKLSMSFCIVTLRLPAYRSHLYARHPYIQRKHVASLEQSFIRNMRPKVCEKEK
jgi:hypothetical protein